MPTKTFQLTKHVKHALMGLKMSQGANFKIYNRAKNNVSDSNKSMLSDFNVQYSYMNIYKRFVE